MTTTTSILAGGGRDDFLTVRHLRIAGSQREIGHALAASADAAHGSAAAPRPASDPRLERTRRRWFAMHHRAHSERMRGMGSAPRRSTRECSPLLAPWLRKRRLSHGSGTFFEH